MAALTDQLGVLYEPVVLILPIPAIAAGTFLAATLVAIGPAWVAGRISPATALRAE